MKILELQQGSPEWHAHRMQHYNASDASAMMGASKYKTRNELLKEYATGIRPEVDANTQRLFDKGHAAEAAARPIAEGIAGEELYPVTGTLVVEEMKLSASFDGLTMDESVNWEHKMLNKDLRNMLDTGLDMHYQWQLAHQMLVSGAEKSLFMASDESEHIEMWVFRDDDLIDRLIAGWKQFSDDLDNYQHIEAQPEAVGRAPESLPALRIEVTGMVTNSNLEAFKAGAALMFSKINRVLETDQDFADAEKTVKHCKEIEDNIEAAKKHALSQTASIDELYRALDSVSAEARAVRLELDKLVKARKENLRIEIQQEAEMAFRAHIDTINTRLNTVQLPPIRADFAGVMKGKKTVTSLRDACDTELARVKIEASQLSEHIGINMDFCSRVIRAEEKHLFHDLSSLVLKPQADMESIIKMRIKEESDRIDAVAAAKIEADRQASIRAQMREQEIAEGMPQPAQVYEEKKPEPAVSATVSVAGTVAQSGKAAHTKRPTDQQIISAVATAFTVDFHTARGWIAEIKLTAEVA